MIPNTTLEQWATVKAVVEAGSFARAAEQLNKSQSTVSYSISRLESRLPAPLFEQAGRRAILTPFGRALLGPIEQLLTEAFRVDQIAQSLATGWETEVTLAIDGIACIDTVFQSLDQFAKECPQTRIRILETTLSGTDEALLSRAADLAITPRVPPGFLGKPYGIVNKVPVAASHHPLSQLQSPITESQLRQFRQVVVRDSGQKREQDAGWLGAEQRWTVTHFASSIKAIQAGLGFGFLPMEMIAAEIKSGNLVKLDLAMGGEMQIPLHLVPSAQDATGKAVTAVMNALIKKT